MNRALIFYLHPLSIIVVIAILFMSVAVPVNFFARGGDLQGPRFPAVSGIEIHQGSKTIEDWNFVPESIRIEIFFSSRIPNSALPSNEGHKWLKSISDDKPVDGVLNMHPSGSRIVWIPIGPLLKDEVYEIQLPSGIELASDYHLISSNAKALGFRVQSAVIPEVSGFQVLSRLALRETRSFQFTSIAFLDKSHAILTDSQSRILLLQLDPITGGVPIPLEIAHLDNQVVQASAIRSIPGSNNHELYISVIPSEIYEKISKPLTDIPEPLSGLGSLHRRRFHWDNSEAEILRWLDDEVLLDAIPFLTSSLGPRPLTALAIVNEEVLLGLGPIGSDAANQNNPQQNTDQDTFLNNSHPLESAILRIRPETKTEIQKALSETTPQLVSFSKDCFLATGIYHPTHLVINSAQNLYLSNSYPGLNNKAITTPEGAGVPSIQHNPGAQLIRVDPGGFYGTPNQARSEFVAFGGNPKPSIDPWEQPEYPIGTFPLASFQEEDLFPWDTRKSPGAMLNLTDPHPLHDRFLIGYGLPAAPIEVVTLKPTGLLLDRHALLDYSNRPIQFSYIRDMAQAPDSMRVYLIADGQVGNGELQPGLWLIEPTP